MTVGTVLSRVTGVLRLAAIAAALGIVESRLPDTYNYANTVPNIIYELVLGGVLTSVFVPVFVELLEKEGRDRAWEVASAILNVSTVVLAAITVVGILVAPWIAGFYASRLEGTEQQLQQEIMTFLLRLFIPQIVFYGIYAILSGLLNSHRRFGPSMYTPILSNVAVIAAFLIFIVAYPEQDAGLASVTTSQLVLIGLGTTAGVAMMALAQIPFLRGLGKYRLTFSLRHPALRKLAGLSVFVVGYVVVNQINYLIVQYLANDPDQKGSYSAYVTAFVFFMLPHGLFAVSVFTALLPGMSEHAVNDRWDAFRDRLSIGIRATALLILPAAVGYFVLGEQVVRFFLERGVMTAASTDLVVGVLRFFVLGLLPFSLFQLFLRAFYALQDTRTPFLINCGAAALNVAINIPMFSWLGVRGLAAGHAVAYVFGVVLQGWALSRRIGGLGGATILAAATRITGAAIGMGALVWGTATLVSGAVDSNSLLGQTIDVGVPVIVGVVSYVALATVFGVRELGYVRQLVSRRFGGSERLLPGR